QAGFSVVAFEAGSGVGGTWYWNRYPGARCDVESLQYAYSFDEDLVREWQWSERYASQPEILRYLNHVADRLDLKRDIRFETRIVSAIFDEATSRWEVTTDRAGRISTQFCIMATGCLSAAKDPEYRGIETFRGKWYQTARWPHEGVDFTGRRVGLIGTGSSAIQAVPVIARQAAQLVVFQRTPNFSVPAQNAPLAPETIRDWKTNHAGYLERARAQPFAILFERNETPAIEASPAERENEYEKRWQYGGIALLGAFGDLIVNKDSNDTAAEFVRAKIRSIVRDPAVAEKLSPRNHPIGAKRLCLDTGYYETFNRENVTLVDLRSEPIQEITPAGLRTAAAEYPLDSIVFATGFDAMTGALQHIDIRGRGGATLRQKWMQGPRAYLGLMISGFPGLFTITGPGSPSVLSNMAVSIEQHVDWIAACLAYLREHGYATIEPTGEAEDGWVAHVAEVGNATLFPLANSWYMGANVPGKPRVFMPYVGGFPVYRQKCDEVAARGYEGFLLSPTAVASGAAPAAAR
ncbi:MAG TPA: NAD(P)/FAD-dependent oxidoreductase, partial [Bryobacteraceae bacterium]|nr:NAD(P)/FAD-dependent oxidoreductase [Bryobacteraceae bacterium]